MFRGRARLVEIPQDYSDGDGVVEKGGEVYGAAYSVSDVLLGEWRDGEEEEEEGGGRHAFFLPAWRCTRMPEI